MPAADPALPSPSESEKGESGSVDGRSPEHFGSPKGTTTPAPAPHRSLAAASTDVGNSPTRRSTSPTRTPSPAVADYPTPTSPSKVPTADNDPKTRTNGFFRFPAEIRNIIYDHALQYPTSSELYRSYSRQIDEYYARKGRHREATPLNSNPDEEDEEEPFPPYTRTLHTPTLLLLNKEITKECLPILRSRTFVVDRLPPWLPGSRRPMLVSQFIGRRTFQHLRRIEIRVPLGQGMHGSGWAWMEIVVDLLKTLREFNEFDRLHMSWRDFSHAEMSPAEVEVRNEIHDMVSSLPTLLVSVVICRFYVVYQRL